MLNLFRAQSKTREGVKIVARINARLQPLDRGDLYEDPLAIFLAAGELGEVTGGSSQLAANGRAEACDIEIMVPHADDATLDAIRAALEQLGAPKGSRLIVEDRGEEYQFGANEGLAVNLNATSLPEEAYRDCDVNVAIEEIDRLLDGTGRVQGFWEGPDETTLYIYGDNAEDMRARIGGFLQTYPLCAKSRIERIA